MVDQAQKIAVSIEYNDGFKSDVICSLLEQMMDQLGVVIVDEDGVSIVVSDDCVLVDKKSFCYPLRAGVVMEAIEKAAFAPRGGSVDYLDLNFSFGKYEYIGSESVCVDMESGQRLRLTDKERDMLGFLYKSDGHKVKRDDLLQMLWGYSKQVETHTIETHIYRLRQKIEVDPSKPKILVTEGDCYCLNVDDP